MVLFFIAPPDAHAHLVFFVLDGMKGSRACCSEAFLKLDQRIGGAYWMPPFDQSAFWPREIFSCEPMPTFFSNTSP